MDIESEIKELKRRVDGLEGVVSVLSGHLAKVHPEVVTLKVGTIDRFDKVEDLVGKVIARVDMLNTQVWSLRDDLPEILEAAMNKVGRSGRI